MLNSGAVVGETTPGEMPPLSFEPEGIDFGDYVLEKEIAHGGMGVVYRAHQLSLNRAVAIKLLLLGRYSSAESIERFRREAQSIGALRHPGIVAVHEIGEHQGQHFISMEYVDGPTLAHLLREGPFTAERAAEITRDVAKAVQYAHERGVLHRDLKPSNVLLDGAGVPRITDFGLAKKLDGSTDLTLTGQMVGTPNYLSPEQASGRHAQVGPASDVYAIGALLYELVTGRPPFMADSLQETLLRIRDSEPISPRVLNPAVDREIETICLKCLEKDSQRRYSSAKAVAAELECRLRGEPIQARPCSGWMRLRKWTLRQPRLAALLLIASLAVLAFFIGQTIMAIRLNRANTRLTSSLYELRWRTADEADRTGEIDEAIAWLSYFLRENLNDSAATARLLCLLSLHNFPLLLHPPLVHETSLAAIDLSRSGDRLATVSGKTARVWNVQSGQLEVLLTHAGELSCAVLAGHNDGRLLTVTDELKARLWDLGGTPGTGVNAVQKSRPPLKEILLGPVEERWIRRMLRLTRNRDLIAINVQSNVIAFLDAESGTWSRPPLSLPEEVCKMALSEDGRLLATASQSRLQLWEISSCKPLFGPQEWTGVEGDIRFSQDSHWLAWLNKSKIRVINTSTGVRQPEFSANQENLAFMDNTEHLIAGVKPTLFNFRTGQDCGSPFGKVQLDWFRHESLSQLLFSFKSSNRRGLLDPMTGQIRTEALFHEATIGQLCLHPNGRVAASASEDRTVRIWSVEMGGTEPMTLQVGGMIYEARWSPSGEKILSISWQNNRCQMQLWNGLTGAALTPCLFSSDVIYSAAWSPDGRRFATASQDFTARIWDGDTGDAISPPLRHDNVVTYCDFSKDGRFLATAGDDRLVRLWDGVTGQSIGPPLVHSLSPLRVDFSKDGRRLATASQDGTVRVWSVPDGKLLVGPLRHDGICWAAFFSPDNRLLVSASSDGTARLWDAQTGQLALPPLRHEGPVFWASFSPDGRALITSTELGIARVWDTRTGQPISEPMRHPNRVWLAKWSSDGRFLVTSCNDGSARVWEASTGHLVAEPFTHQPGKEVRRVDFSPDGRRLLTGSHDGTIKIWDLTFLRPPMPAPDWLPELAEALGGKHIGAKDAPESVSGNTFQRVKERIAQAREPDYYTRWARWMLEERRERPVKPFRP